MALFESFFRSIDAAWGPGKIRLSIIGSAALMLQTDYRRGTKDSDVLETTMLRHPDKERLIALAGPASSIFRRHRLYIDVVANGVPFLPHGARFVPCESLNRSLTSIQVEALDVVDVVVSKFKRFHANDQSDIVAMIERDLVPHARLLERFRSAADLFAMDARSPALPAYVERLHRIERDVFGVAPSSIELPEWE